MQSDGSCNNPYADNLFINDRKVPTKVERWIARCLQWLGIGVLIVLIPGLPWMAFTVPQNSPWFVLGVLGTIPLACVGIILALVLVFHFFQWVYWSLTTPDKDAWETMLEEARNEPVQD